MDIWYNALIELIKLSLCRVLSLSEEWLKWKISEFRSKFNKGIEIDDRDRMFLDIFNDVENSSSNIDGIKRDYFKITIHL